MIKNEYEQVEFKEMSNTIMLTFDEKMLMNFDFDEKWFKTEEQKTLKKSPFFKNKDM